ncbi:NADP-dependent oxidoreductase [Streptomyces sp. NBC_01707]|uniref:NADP-dependent oxidoreductase n=1 Tax=unclassified Streptomyces TaxID=2593676 RepID=UPI0029AB7440|nr:MULTISPECIES: NADP-dependent oxidoreductase [unclassified Streptomyces]MDX3771796.1 NADP-dependent oxidoreductase [Streptomyces sp. AK08-01B]MDX3821348.1 NADP-dependent oxidoreductase [Streptomyces sp. AK08-01A]
MKAVGVRRFGGPEALRVLDIPEPHAGPGQVRIRIRAASVNPGDRYLRNGSLGSTSAGPPYIPGMEAAGVVDEIGEGTVTDLCIGDRVMALTMPTDPSGGAYAQYLSLPEQWVARAPAGSTHAEASTLPMNGLTARQALDLLALPARRTVAVTGGAGVVGGYVIQMAKAADGLTVIADAWPEDEELVRSLGADIVIPRGDDFAQHVLRNTPEGVDGVVDAASMGSAAVARAVRDGGGISLLVHEDLYSISPAKLRRRSLNIHTVLVSKHLGDRSRLDRLRLQAEAGDLTLRVARTLPAAQATEAHRLLEAGGVRGRLVLEF